MSCRGAYFLYSSGAQRMKAVCLMAALFWIAAGSGCASSRMADLRKAPHNPLAEKFQIKSWSGAKPSERTMLVLRRTTLDDRISRRIDTRPDEIIGELTKVLDRDPQLEYVYALAELNYIAAGRKEDSDEAASIRYSLQSIERCGQYLFDPRFDEVRNPYDPQFRGACDLYNSALERCLRFARKDGLFKPGGRVSFASVGSKLNLRIEPQSGSWKADDFEQFEFVSDYRMKGLANQYQTHGLGVPLIAFRRGGTGPPGVERYYARNLSFPVTAFLRLDHSDTTREAVLELHDPLDETTVDVAGLKVPLESDVTTPLAYFLDQPQLQKLDTQGLLRPAETKKIAGLYMVQPYQPGKIPVLMIHGLWSSPMTWMEAFNDLRAIPEIRERYQFWFYLYPSGQPFWESSADLREHLALARRTFNADGRDPAFDDMVLVGHSMGGLVARMMTVESGNRYWDSISRKPFQQVKGDADTIRQLERQYFFENVPQVTRVVTIGSPHRGSNFANDFTRRAARSVIALPTNTLKTTARLLMLNPDLLRDGNPQVAATSIDSLAPESPILRVLAETPTPAGVHAHNIVGITKHDVPLEKNTDGVVPYPSAHRTDVDSELVLRVDHMNIHRHPATINELWKILKIHKDEIDARGRDGIVPLGGEAPGGWGSGSPSDTPRK
jgi:pimeloyl-ACP methyl ester carboxylesterase